MFGKQKNLYHNYKRQSAKINQILFTKTCKQQMVIQIMVYDWTLIANSKYNLQQQEVDAVTQVYQLSINNNQENNRLLRLMNGYSGIQKFLSVSDNWLFDEQKRIFKMGNLKTVFYEKQATKNKTFDVFSLEEIIQALKDKIFVDEIESKYLINKALQIISKEKKGKKQIDREQVLKNKEEREQQVKKQRLKRKIQMDKDDGKNLNEEKIITYIRNDSFKFDSFNIDGLSIVKQYQDNKGRCLFGSISIDKKNNFIIKINKLSKQNRDPVFWIGVVDNSCLKSQSMEEITNVIAMSDQKKITYVSELNKNKKITPKNKNNQFNKLLQFEEEDVIKVQVNTQLGVITWTNQKNEELGSHQSQLLKLKHIQWVPFMEIFKIGDSISWYE